MMGSPMSRSTSRGTDPPTLIRGSHHVAVDGDVKSLTFLPYLPTSHLPPKTPFHVPRIIQSDPPEGSKIGLQTPKIAILGSISKKIQNAIRTILEVQKQGFGILKPSKRSLGGEDPPTSYQGGAICFSAVSNSPVRHHAFNTPGSNSYLQLFLSS